MKEGVSSGGVTLVFSLNLATVTTGRAEESKRLLDWGKTSSLHLNEESTCLST